MKLRDFRIGWRLLVQEPAYSAVSVLGLALGLAACFLLLGFVHYCLSYNSQVPDGDRVVAVKQRINLFPRPDWQVHAYMPLRDAALESGMAEQAAIVKGLDLPLQVGAQLHQVMLHAASPEFAPMFGLRALQGDLQAALSRPDGIALSAAAARRLFGQAPALGQRVMAGGQYLQVMALMADAPANTTRPYQALVGIASPVCGKDCDYAAAWHRRGQVYLKLKPGASAAALGEYLQRYVEQSPNHASIRQSAMGQSFKGRNITDIALVGVRQQYFDADLANGRNGAQYGRRSALAALAGIALLVLLLAASNYVNLATVRTLRRQREIGMRKLLGAGRAQLVGQFMAESALVALLAAVLGLLLAWLCLPLFGELVQRKLGGMLTPASCAAMLLAGLATGLCAGIYPAWLALRVRPAAALTGRGDSETAGGLWLRRVLTVLQFGTAMALSGAALAIAWQTDFASRSGRGFDPSGLLVLDLPQVDKATYTDFSAALARLPGVSGVAGISEAVGRDGMKIVINIPARGGARVNMEVKDVTPGLFALYGVAPRHGRLFDPARDSMDSRVAVVNASAALALGYATAEQALGQFTGELEIIGIAPDLRYQSLREPIQPLLYRLGRSQVLTLRSSDELAAVQRAIEPLWRRTFPNEILELHAAASFFGADYAEDLRLAKMLALAGLLATALAAFGIYVLSAYNVRRRTREIVLRKLYGAGRGAIARLVGKEFAALIAAGALLGLPLAGVAIERYLAGFVVHAPMGAWPLAAALTLALLVALAATARHTLAALRIAPAAALRG